MPVKLRTSPPDLGRNIFSYSPYAGEERLQRQTVLQPAIQSALGVMNPMGGGRAGLPSWYPQYQSSAAMPSSGIVSQAGPYYGIQMTRDPEMEAAVQDVLTRIRATDLNRIDRDVRSPMVGGLAATAGGQLAQDVTTGRQSLADFTKQFLQATPEVQRYTGQEIGRIGEVYGGAGEVGSFANQLANIRRQATSALENKLRTNLGQTVRAGKLASMAGAPNAYTDRILAQETARILAENALQDAGLARADELAVREAQAALTGRRGSLLDQSLLRQLLPTQQAEALRQSQLGSLAQLAGVELPNVIAQRGSEPLASEIDLLTRLLGPREAATYRGLGSTEGPDLRGLNIGREPDLSGYDLDPSLLLSMLSAPGRETPSVTDTTGAALEALGPRQLGAGGSGLTSQQLADFLIQSMNQGSMNYGSGSLASLLGLPGTTTTNRYGQQFVRNQGGGYSLVGPDMLTDLQRWYDTPNPIQ